MVPRGGLPFIPCSNLYLQGILPRLLGDVTQSRIACQALA